MRKFLIVLAGLFFVGIPWLLVLYFGGVEVQRFIQCGVVNASDVARRLTAPDSSRTAVLTREFWFDMNFRLYIIDDSFSDPPCRVSEALWSSRDYNPDPRDNWHEDIEWSKDSSVIAVIINGQYMFAYDFAMAHSIEDHNDIQQLLNRRETQEQ